MKTVLTITVIKKIMAKISLIFGIVLLIISNFSGKIVEPLFIVFLLSLGVLLSEPNKNTHQKNKKTILHYFLIGSYFIVTALSYYLIMANLQDIPWDTIYYFSPKYLSIIRVHYNNEPTLGLIVISFLLSMLDIQLS